jgi:hypothetical protein
MRHANIPIGILARLSLEKMIERIVTAIKPLPVVISL